MCITTLLSNLTVRTTFLKSREGKVPNMLAFHENNVLNAWHCSHPHFVSTLCVGNYNLPNFLLCLFTGWRHFITSTRILQGSACEQGARSIQPNFPEISAQNSMDRFGPTGKVSEKRVHLLRWSSFPGRTGWNFGWMDRAQALCLGKK